MLICSALLNQQSVKSLNTFGRHHHLIIHWYTLSLTAKGQSHRGHLGLHLTFSFWLCLASTLTVWTTSVSFCIAYPFSAHATWLISISIPASVLRSTVWCLDLPFAFVVVILKYWWRHCFGPLSSPMLFWSRVLGSSWRSLWSRVWDRDRGHSSFSIRIHP